MKLVLTLALFHSYLATSSLATSSVLLASSSSVFLTTASLTAVAFATALSPWGCKISEI